jgi:hypothetical protein
MEKYIVKVHEDRTIWYNEKGQLHRLNGPAVECKNGYKYWHQNGQFHRTDGPAVEGLNGYKEYWINGNRIAEEEFNNRTKPTKPCSGKKVIVDGVEYTLS